MADQYRNGLLSSKLDLKNTIREALMELNHETKGGVIKMIRRRIKGGENAIINGISNLDPNKIAEYGEKGVKYLTGVNLPFQKVVAAVLNNFGQLSKLQKSIQASQKLDKLGYNFNEIVQKYGADSDTTKAYAATFPERVYQYVYLYNTPNDPSSGLKYPQNYQDLAIYETDISNKGNHGAKYDQLASQFAQSVGINYNDPMTNQITQAIRANQQTLGLYGHYVS